MGDYKITKIIFVKRSKTHIPYYLGCFIEGPKGGKYYLDEFSTEVCLRQKHIDLAYSARTTNTMYSIGNKKGIMESIQEAEYLEKLYDFKGVKRLTRNIKDSEKIGKGLML